MKHLRPVYLEQCIFPQFYTTTTENFAKTTKILFSSLADRGKFKLTRDLGGEGGGVGIVGMVYPTPLPAKI